jgi:hypothetical protein
LPINDKSLEVLNKRLEVVEKTLARKNQKMSCNCRNAQETKYHTAKDLEKIMQIPCPIHRFRDLGALIRVPEGSPLLVDDRYLCACPPSPTREWLESKRGPLTEAEQREACDKWQLIDEADKTQLSDDAKISTLLHAYFANKRRRDELQRNNKSG